MRTCITVVALALALPAAAPALEVELRSVETDLVVGKDGRGAVHERLDWRASGGQMHGFYFEGAAGTPEFDLERSHANLAGTTQVGLSITPLSPRRFDVVLAGGRGFSGLATYVLDYQVDLVGAGSVGITQSPEHGELYYFDWSPEEWKYPLQHRTIRVVLPIEVAGKKVSAEELARLGLRTEPHVNQENKFDVLGVQEGDLYHLTLRFHQTELASRQAQRIQFYLKREAMPAGLAPVETGPGSARPAGIPDEPRSAPADEPHSKATSDFGPLMPIAAFALLILGLVLLFRAKARGFSRVAQGPGHLAWDEKRWSAPKLLVGTFQVKGKIVPDLHPVESALLLEKPLDRIVAIMLEGLQRNGVLRVESEKPLRIHVIAADRAEHEYEKLFLAAFDAKGEVVSARLSSFFETALAKLQEKIWDCDVEATKAYYRERLEPGAGAAAEEDRGRPEGSFWLAMRELLWNQAMYSDMALPDEFHRGYLDFMASSSCFRSCFTAQVGDADGACHSACHDACHSACHDACHSACHDACHSACHDACHSACHSACHDAYVSGDAH